MVKVTFDLNDALNEKLRLYINKNFPLKTHGMVKQILEESLEEWLTKHGVE
ncbi:MAG: hypothetical protein ABSA75_10260 [Candidatus Bathyarchaeia archaeon]|jgi:hypothetical protein